MYLPILITFISIVRFAIPERSLRDIRFMNKMKRFSIPPNKLKSNYVAETASSVSDLVDPNDPNNRIS